MYSRSLVRLYILRAPYIKIQLVIRQQLCPHLMKIGIDTRQGHIIEVWFVINGTTHAYRSSYFSLNLPHSMKVGVVPHLGHCIN